MSLDWLLHYGFKVFVYGIGVAFGLVWLFWITRFLLWLLVRIPVQLVRGDEHPALKGAGDWLKRFSSKVHIGALALPFVPIALFVLVVLGGTVGIAIGLYPWLVPRHELGASEVAHHAPDGFRDRFLGRLISIRSMEWPLRLITAVAIAQMVAAAVLLLTGHGHEHGHGSMITLPAQGGAELQMNVLAFGACVAFLVVAWSFVLTGAAEARRGRFIIAAIFTFVTRPAVMEDPHAVPWVGLNLLVWNWLGVLAWRERCAIRTAGEAPPVTWGDRHWRLGVALALLAGYYTVLAQVPGPSGEAAGFAVVISRQVFELAIFLAPVLFLTGADFAELSELMIGTVLQPVRKAGSRVLSALLLVLASGVIGYLTFQNQEADFSGLSGLGAALILCVVFALAFVVLCWDAQGLVFGCVKLPLLFATLAFAGISAMNAGGVSVMVLAVVLICALAFVFNRSHRGRWVEGHVSFPALAVTALFLTGAHEIVTLLHRSYSYPPDAPLEIPFVLYDHEDSHLSAPFNMAVPDTWTAHWLADLETVHLDSGDPYRKGEFFVASRGLAELGDLKGHSQAELIAKVWSFNGEADVTFLGDSWGWRESAVKLFREGKRYRGFVWVRQIDERIWFLGGFHGTRYEPYFFNLFVTMLKSWQLEPAPELPPPLKQRDLGAEAVSQLSFGLVPVLLAPAGLFLLYFRRRRDGPVGTPRQMAGFFAVTVGLIAFLFLPYEPLTELWSPVEAASHGEHDRVSFSDPLAGLTVSVALIAVLLTPVILWRCPRKTAHAMLCELAQLLGGLAMLTLGYWLYGAVIVTSGHSIIFEAAILVVALLWDLMMSGKEITNVDGLNLRRPTRVLIYVGYLVLVCTAILFYCSLREADGDPATRVLEAEKIVRQGIVWLGSPLLVLHSIAAILRLRAGAMEESQSNDGIAGVN